MWTAALAFGVVLGGGTVAHALWSITQPLPEVTVATGDFDLTATWQRAPDLEGLFPGESVTGSGTVHLNSDASWQYRLDENVQGSLGG
ncbi:hypothetical protein PU560_09445, partial [Georgenia sp. 10Sc9-8]|nr:hypothetical protein [Georgenia halotolerans]